MEQNEQQDNPLKRVLWEWEYADFFTVGASCQGCLIMGGTGSSKTTSSGAMIAGHYLSNGYGMLVLTAKGDEKERFIRYCKQYGRERDIVVFGPNSGEYFNFYDYELSREDDGKGLAHNIADVLLNVMKSGGNDGHETDKAFWTNTLSMLIINAIELCLITNNKRFEHVYQIIQSAPRNREQLKNKKWRDSSKCFQLIHHVVKHLSNKPETEEVKNRIRQIRQIEDFFLDSWVNLSEKTRSIVEQMFFGFGDRFMREPVYSLCNGKTTITPDDTMKGKIIIIDLPYMIYDKTGQDIQNLWKYLWQRAMQRRKITKTSRPCCIWVDEFQYFMNPEKDIQFQSTARSYRACSVYITQNVPNVILNAGGGEHGKTRFKALAGNLSTKFFHCNSDPETNEFAADLIGRDWQWSANEGHTMGENFSFNRGQSESFQYIVDPQEFTKLKTGGAENNFLAEAIVHRIGKSFESTGYNYKKVTLKQILL
ncbi:type IV secretory system conjugative DNA transfer family protein [uncultured Croceitalea sp.]|uniref:type IV secretory system conjugative DNA transfer family protein n=1 Tax=uncultured Croceitalea sp. TaxID=1798908 RepID=UPI00374F619E